MVDSNLVHLLARLNSKLKQNYDSKTREKKNSDTKDYFFDVARALPVVSMLNHQGVYIPLNRLIVPNCRIIV